MAPAGYGARVEGVHAVTAAVEAGRVIRLTVESRRRDRPEVARLIDRVSDVRFVDDTRTLADSEAPQGLIAECSPIVPIEIDSLAVDGASVLVLDHLEDPQNVGAIARSAAAAGCTGLVISGRRSAPLSASAFKAAAGALEHLPVAIVGSIAEALQRLKSLDVWIVGLDGTADTSLFGLSLLTEPVAIVIGAEGAGLSHLVSKRCDIRVAIPMAERAESLNASVSAALAVFEIMRVRSKMPG
ncbi:MAG TPA: RNA methyltransferase [Acidimicrobiia bacterium]